MRLSEIFDYLASGELGNLYLADGSEMIKQDKLPIVLRSINLGLTKLHNLFDLKQKKALVKINKKREYEFKQEDFIQIIRVMYEGRELAPLSRMTGNDGYILLKPNVIYLPDDFIFEGKLEVVYKANHPILTKDDIVKDSHVDLHYGYLNALLYFIANRLYESLNNQMDGDLHESNRYKQKFYDEVASLVNQGVVINTLDEYQLYRDKGFI